LKILFTFNGDDGLRSPALDGMLKPNQPDLTRDNKTKTDKMQTFSAKSTIDRHRQLFTGLSLLLIGYHLLLLGCGWTMEHLYL
jgi:hypothetical protein